MEVSVIVPTFNGAAKISCLLDALLNQTMLDFELIVVVDGSTDNTVQVVAPYISKFGRLKLIEQSNTGRAAVRNRGAKEAEGELLIFYDDDMSPSLDSVQKHWNFHEKTKQAILCGYPVEGIDESKSDIQNYKASQTLKWTARYKDGLNRIVPESPFLTAANFSIRKELFEQLHGFDERLTDIEDLEFAKRALQQNLPIYFDKTNTAVHLDFITCLSYILRVRQYTKAQQHLHSLFPEEFPDRNLKVKYKKVMYRLFAFPCWPNLIDRSKAILILPRRVRYKLYDWVIYSLGVVYGEVPLQKKTK